MRFLLSLPALLLPVFAVACAASNDGSDDTGASVSNLDTSGCSSNDGRAARGPVAVSALKPIYKSCWNVDDGGIAVIYTWQQDQPSPSKPDLGFWASLNGASKFEKAQAFSCAPTSGFSMGPDTSGRPSYTCTAETRFAFRQQPEMKNASFGSDGSVTGWHVEVAVALDANGNWDSLNGANYKFDF